MKKISSKIIISVLLAVVFFGGFSLNYRNGKINTTLGVKNIYAAVDCTAEATAAKGAPVGSSANVIYKNCLQQQIDELKGTNSSAQLVDDIWTGAMTFTKGVHDAAGKTVDVALGLAKLPAFAVLATWLLIIGTVINAITFIIAMVFDAIFEISMMSFSTIITSAGVDTAWEIIRNIINISFIFVLLYIAISIILGSFGPSKKSTVAGVVISALLINFSLLITRIIIDVGNMLAMAIYEKAWHGPGISTWIMEGLQLQTLLSPNVITATGQSNTVTLMVIQIILSLVFISVLLYGIIFLLGRLVTLVALLALSPIGFIGFSMPWLKDKADEWWKALIDQVFLLPIFLFFLMMANSMLRGAWSIAKILHQTPEQWVTTTGFDVGAWVNYCLIIAMLLMSVKMTKKMSGGVGKIVDAVGKGFKYAAAFGAVFVASAVSGGAAAGPAKALLGRMAGAGGITGAAGRGIQGIARSNAGQALQSSAKAVAGTLGAAGIEGTIARAMMTNALHQVKTHTGVDLEGAHKDVNGAQKDKIGPAQIDEEIKRRNETMGNINTRAESSLGEDTVGKKLAEKFEESTEAREALNKNIEKLGKEIEKSQSPETKEKLVKAQDIAKQQLEAIKADVEARGKALEDQKKAREIDKKAEAKKIGAKMGYDVEEHDKKIGYINDKGEKVKGELYVEKEKRMEALDTHLNELSQRGYRGNKAAETLRALHGDKFKAKSKWDELRDEMEAKVKKDLE